MYGTLNRASQRQDIFESGLVLRLKSEFSAEIYL